MSLQRFDVRDYPIDSADLAAAELEARTEALAA
jgi:hypothetical protein